eukprot:5226438-Pleurochrysis_carterae.AAC.5
MQCSRRKHHSWWRRAPLPCALRVTRVVLGMGVACMAVAEAGVLQLSIHAVLSCASRERGKRGQCPIDGRGAFARVHSDGHGHPKQRERRRGRSVLCEREHAHAVHPRPPCSWQAYAGHSRFGMKTRSPGLDRVGAGRRRRVHCVRGAGKVAVALASALGGGYEEATAAAGAADCGRYRR